eukprot:75710-Pelagomonas_calceolata.AAC.3
MERLLCLKGMLHGSMALGRSKPCWCAGLLGGLTRAIAPCNLQISADHTSIAGARLMHAAKSVSPA